MAPAKQLKVFRTAIGFHDAYVAAPSRKAALAAWGSTHDLFARGQAELVEDTALTAAPLASPGKVIKRLRGTDAEQIAALPPDKEAKRASPKPAAAPPSRGPRPSRAAVEKAERALATAEERHARAADALAAKAEEIERQRRALRDQQREERDRLRATVDEAEVDHTRAMEKWRG